MMIPDNKIKQPDAITYAKVWDILKSGAKVKLTISKFQLKTIKRMVSKTKDMDAGYKLLNPTRAKLLYTVNEVSGSVEMITLTIVLKQFNSNYTSLLEETHG